MTPMSLFLNLAQSRTIPPVKTDLTNSLVSGPTHSYVNLLLNKGGMMVYCRASDSCPCSVRHRGGRMKKINAWYLNTHMVYL
jgi:hypothetical protein